jgi:formylglycine-generating enzyme required for sulfatase activity
MAELDGGWFLMGTDDAVGFPDDGEGPVREVYVSPFAMDRYAVTNREFSRFVEATGYVTDAERFGWSFVFRNFIPKVLFKKQQVRTVPGLEWWYAVTDANWYRPEGRGSNIRKRMDHPVVHVSWNDARAYCRWAGVRLPTEAEWEYAARGGLEQKRYVWGDELHPGGKHMCNIWQGDFPERNTAEDGYAGTAPVDAFKPNGYGLYNMAGNVWEWCADFWSATFHVNGPREDPAGPPRGSSRVMRGGSYLCHHSYCNRYRVAARTSNTPDSSTGNMGFRCVRSPESR